MSSEDDIKSLIDKTIEKYGRLDCLINNAGTHPVFTLIDDFSVQDFKDLLNINLVRSGANPIKKFSPHLFPSFQFLNTKLN
jgi:NAD(P)-dependent dehydrogenase (short-subunit alcohol dehydrogenase family)